MYLVDAWDIIPSDVAAVVSPNIVMNLKECAVTASLHELSLLGFSSMHVTT